MVQLFFFSSPMRRTRPNELTVSGLLPIVIWHPDVIQKAGDVFDWKVVEIVCVERKLYGAARSMVRCLRLNLLVGWMVWPSSLSDVLAFALAISLSRRFRSWEISSPQNAILCNDLLKRSSRSRRGNDCFGLWCRFSSCQKGYS